MKIRLGVLVAICAALSGCGSITVPVAVISQNGDMMRGTSTADLSGGSFQVQGSLNGRETKCSGTYNSLDQSITISMPVICNDGRKGIVIATRQQNGLDGSGRVRLNDGTEADFIFGRAAGAL